MGCSDFKTINGKRYYKQATFTNRYGAMSYAKIKRRQGYTVRTIKKDSKWVIYMF